MAKYKYRNKKTKAILETDCKISGGDWVEGKSEKDKTKKDKADGTDNE